MMRSKTKQLMNTPMEESFKILRLIFSCWSAVEKSKMDHVIAKLVLHCWHPWPENSHRRELHELSCPETGLPDGPRLLPRKSRCSFVLSTFRHLRPMVKMNHEGRLKEPFKIKILKIG